MATKARSIRVDDTTWDDWTARAKAAGVSVASLITDRMAAPEPDPAASPQVAHVTEADLAAVRHVEFKSRADARRAKRRAGKPRPPRTTMCEHRIPPDRHCKTCDG